MFTAQQLPLEEIQRRLEKCRHELLQQAPLASGMLIFSRTNVYYLTGTRANGILWLPRQGEPVLMVRKGVERCRLESPLKHIIPFKSYTHIPQLCQDCGAPLTFEDKHIVGTEMRALPWSLAEMLVERLAEYTFIDTSAALDTARSVKTAYELTLMEHSAAQQSTALLQELPKHLQAGMTERHIAHALWKIYYALGHGGMLRQDRYNEDIFLGSITTGIHSLAPSTFRCSVGCVGEHASMPYMGYAGNAWNKGQTLMVDTGFMHEGYHSNAAATYFCGKKEHLPQEVHKAYALCVAILKQAQKQICAGMSLQTLWAQACTMAQEAGFAQQFMTMNNGSESSRHNTTVKNTEDPCAARFCYNIGLSMDEWPALNQQTLPCQQGNVLVVAPMVALPNKGVVGIKALFTVEQDSCTCLTSYAAEIPCIE